MTKTVDLRTTQVYPKSKNTKKKVYKWRDGTIKSMDNAFNWRITTEKPEKVKK